MELLHLTDTLQLYYGNALEVIKTIPDGEIQSCVTSPTYWGKRQFTTDPDEFGIEPLEVYLQKNIQLYDTILTKMKKTGSLFIIIQDSYMGSGVSRTQDTHWETTKSTWRRDGLDAKKQGNTSRVTAKHDIIQYKSLCGIPFRIANELVDKGYLWRQLILWEKNNPMPDGSHDKCMTSVEYVLHFTKSPKYTFHEEWFSEKGSTTGKLRLRHQVWNINSVAKHGHTATFPRSLVRPLVLGTTNPNDLIFEPFLGSGTIVDLARQYGRKCIACDINKKFVLRAINREKSDIARWM